MMNHIKAALVAGAALLSFSAHADDKNFDGPYVGAEVGYTEFSGGSDGVYYGGLVGFRKQLDNKLVLGLEGSFGSADIDFLDHIWSVGATVGYVLGDSKKGLLYVGSGYAESKSSAFGATVKGGDYTVKLGYEHVLNNTLSLRVQTYTVAFDAEVMTLGLIARF